MVAFKDLVMVWGLSDLATTDINDMYSFQVGIFMYLSHHCLQ